MAWWMIAGVEALCRSVPVEGGMMMSQKSKLELAVSLARESSSTKLIAWLTRYPQADHLHHSNFHPGSSLLPEDQSVHVPFVPFAQPDAYVESPVGPRLLPSLPEPEGGDD